MRLATTKIRPYIIKKDRRSVGDTRIISRTTCTVTLRNNAGEAVQIAGDAGEGEYVIICSGEK